MYIKNYLSAIKSDSNNEKIFFDKIRNKDMNISSFMNYFDEIRIYIISLRAVIHNKNIFFEEISLESYLDDDFKNYNHILEKINNKKIQIYTEK